MSEPHTLSALDADKREAFCGACQRVVDVYAYKSKGVTAHRCGPRSRQYRRKQYEQENPNARKYKRHPEVLDE
jgi:hypothetical protein